LFSDCNCFAAGRAFLRTARAIDDQTASCLPPKWDCRFRYLDIAAPFWCPRSSWLEAVMLLDWIGVGSRPNALRPPALVLQDTSQIGYSPLVFQEPGDRKEKIDLMTPKDLDPTQQHHCLELCGWRLRFPDARTHGSQCVWSTT
jgi:hypothetical protein